MCSGCEGVGRVAGDFIEATAARSMGEYIGGGFSADVKFRAKLSKSHLLPPTTPSKIICLGWNYLDHIEELGASKPEKPMIFFKPPSALVGHGADVVLPDPALTGEVNNEVELAVVVGKTAKNVVASQAMEYVGGYTIIQDITARDIQRVCMDRSDQWEIAKSFDTFAPLGPWIVPAGEIPDPHVLGIKLTVNGKVRQDSNTSNMLFKVPEIVEYLSSVMTLLPGDVVATGTPAGVYLIKSGDVLEAEIEGIGVLRNTVR